MKRVSISILSVIGILSLLFGVAASTNPFGSVANTSGGYPTWDSDMINIENVTETGAGVYVAVLDTGLASNWADFFPKERIATNLGTGFYQPVSFRASSSNKCGLEVIKGKLQKSTWVGSTSSTHGTHVSSTILGYFYRNNYDAAAGFPLPPIIVRGIAPEVTIIPVKVLADYQVPGLPKCDNPGPIASQKVNFGTSGMVAAGINYATDLAIAGYKPMVINMSLGGDELSTIEQTAIDRAIANGVVVVASAGNEGESGMGYPGAYAPVISTGSVGWIGEWLYPGTSNEFYRMWWLQYNHPPLYAGSGVVADPTSVGDVYVSDFSSRGLEGQDLDVLAPGSWVRGPYPGDPGYAHLPWWSKGIGDLVGGNPGSFYYVGGTSMSAPHVTAVAALALQKDPSLTQTEIETLLESTALVLPATGTRHIYDRTSSSWLDISWDTSCGATACTAVGAGLLQADAFLTAIP